MEGILLLPFYLRSGIDCTAAFPSFLLPSFLLFPSTLASSLDVLKGHVKYSEGIFITVLSGNACGLISLSVRGRRAKWIAKREIKCIRLPVCFFYLFQREDYIIFIKFMQRERTQILGFIQRYNQKKYFFAAWTLFSRMPIKCKINLDSLLCYQCWFSSNLFHLNWLLSEASK